VEAHKHKEKARLGVGPSIRTDYATSFAWQYQPCRPPSTYIKLMIGLVIGIGMPRSHNNSPRPMTSSCFTSS
jgi:hypothetical protein